MTYGIIVLFSIAAKLYIPSTINIIRKVLTGAPKPFEQKKNGLVSGRLACISSKTKILNRIII